jgi:hypothetical protein
MTNMGRPRMGASTTAATSGATRSMRWWSANGTDGILGHPPQQTGRAVLVHVVFTLLIFALATVYRLQCEREATRGEPVGWQRWRRHLLEQTWDKIIVFTQGYYGIFHLAEYSLLLGVRLKDEPPGVGTLQQVLAKYGFPAGSRTEPAGRGHERLGRRCLPRRCFLQARHGQPVIRKNHVMLAACLKVRLLEQSYFTSHMSFRH